MHRFKVHPHIITTDDQCEKLRVRSGTFSRCEIPAKIFLCWNMILCKKMCCSGTDIAGWKRFLVCDNASQTQILLRPSIYLRLRDCDSVCYLHVTRVMHQQTCMWVIDFTCINNVNGISIHSTYVISRVVDQSDFIAQRLRYRITTLLYNTKGPLSHINLHNHDAVSLSVLKPDYIFLR